MLSLSPKAIAATGAVLAACAGALVLLRKRRPAYMSGQLAQPHGLFGRILMPRVLRRLNNAVVEEAVNAYIGLEPHHDVLEIGFGSGEALALMLDRVPRRVYGLERSKAMFDTVVRKQGEAVSSGRLTLTLGDVQSPLGLPFGKQAFDRVFSMNCVYFWTDLDRALTNILAALKPGGKLVLVTKFQCATVHANQPDSPFVNTSMEDVLAALARVGFADAKVVERMEAERPSDQFQVITASRS